MFSYRYSKSGGHKRPDFLSPFHCLHTLLESAYENAPEKLIVRCNDQDLETLKDIEEHIYDKLEIRARM